MSTFYTAFTVTNLSGHACRVAGTPRLEALDVGNSRIGAAAHPGGMPSESRRRSLRIPAHGDAAFRASWPENAYAAGECRPRTVAGYRVFLPGSHMARFVPFPGPERCSNPNAERAFSVGRLEEPDEPRGGGRATAPVLITPRPGERLPRCPASKLVVWLGVDAFAGVGGGHSYTRLDVINLSGRPCELSGDPRVVAVGNAGRPIGPPARGGPGMVAVGRAGRRVPVARLRPDGTAEFMLSIADPGDYGAGECGWKQAAGLRITFPGSKRTQTLPMPLRRCPHRMVGGPQLSVGPLE
jgi:hypothetical protein